MIVYNFTTVEFEDAVAIQMNGAWLGVNSVQFNSSATLQGILTWIEGYQFKIDFDGNDITLGAKNNYGVPVGCETFFDIVDNCDKLISYINGVTVNVSPGKFNLLAGQNVVVYDDPANNRIYVGLNFDTNTSICVAPIPNPSPNIK